MEMTKRIPTMLEILKDEATKNKAVEATLHLFAMRHRGRRQVTLGALYEALHHEGFQYDKKQVGEVLTVLAQAGLGKLIYDGKGRIRSLTNIELTLPSIGQAVLGSDHPKKMQRVSMPRLKKVPLALVHDAPKTPAVKQTPAETQAAHRATVKKVSSKVTAATINIQGVEYHVKLEPVPKKGGNA